MNAEHWRAARAQMIDSDGRRRAVSRPAKIAARLHGGAKIWMCYLGVRRSDRTYRPTSSILGRIVRGLAICDCKLRTLRRFPSTVNHDDVDYFVAANREGIVRPALAICKQGRWYTVNVEYPPVHNMLQGGASPTSTNDG